MVKKKILLSRMNYHPDVSNQWYSVLQNLVLPINPFLFFPPLIALLPHTAAATIVVRRDSRLPKKIRSAGILAPEFATGGPRLPDT